MADKSASTQKISQLEDQVKRLTQMVSDKDAELAETEELLRLSHSRAVDLNKELRRGQVKQAELAQQVASLTDMCALLREQLNGNQSDEKTEEH